MSPWNDATDRQLLLTIIHLTSPSPPEWNKVASKMGPKFTAEAVRQHFAKLRKEGEAAFGNNTLTDAPATPNAKGTPRQRKGIANGEKNGAGTPAKSTEKKRKAAEAEVDDGGDGEESPEKKVKAEEEGED